jgi:ethanolamine utilization protein EutN
MRIARVIGTLTMPRRLSDLKPGRWVIAETLDATALAGEARGQPGSPRKSPMPEALVVFDPWGAGIGQLIAVSEGAEATAPFVPDKVPIDAYAAAVLDRVEFEPMTA